MSCRIGIDHQPNRRAHSTERIFNQRRREAIVDRLDMIVHKLHGGTQRLSPFLVRAGFETASAVGTPALDSVGATPRARPIDSELALRAVFREVLFAIRQDDVIAPLQENERPRKFRTPWGPVVPILSILSCLVLMASLPLETWARFVVWLIIGLVIYFSYSKRHSEFGSQPRALKAAPAPPPHNSK